MRAITKILVPVDFSEHSEVALHHAIDAATRYGAKITLVHVHEPLLSTTPAQGLSPAVPEPAWNAAIERLGEFARSVNAGEVDLSDLRCIAGNAPAAIVSLAEGESFGLIVMCTQGRSGIKRWVLGSVAELVVREASCPVVTIRPTISVPEDKSAEA